MQCEGCDVWYVQCEVQCEGCGVCNVRGVVCRCGVCSIRPSILNL